MVARRRKELESKEGIFYSQQRRLRRSPAEHYENHKLELSGAWEPGDSSCTEKGPATRKTRDCIFNGDKA